MVPSEPTALAAGLEGVEVKPMRPAASTVGSGFETDSVPS